MLRAHLEDCAVVLGSATPSLESIHNALTGKYSLVKLTERADGQQLPLIRILDMKTEGRNKSGPNVISERLRMSIDRRLDKGEQVILLLNRRGFARSIQCPDCGHVVTCLHCSLPLTYHRTEDRLMCHLVRVQGPAAPHLPGVQVRQYPAPGVRYPEGGGNPAAHLSCGAHHARGCGRGPAQKRRQNHSEPVPRP